MKTQKNIFRSKDQKTIKSFPKTLNVNLMLKVKGGGPQDGVAWPPER